MSHWHNGDIITPRRQRGCARRQLTRALAFPTIAVPNARTLPLSLLFRTRVVDECSSTMQHSRRRRRLDCGRRFALKERLCLLRYCPIALHNCTHVRERIFLPALLANARSVQIARPRTSAEKERKSATLLRKFTTDDFRRESVLAVFA